MKEVEMLNYLTKEYGKENAKKIYKRLNYKIEKSISKGKEFNKEVFFAWVDENYAKIKYDVQKKSKI